MKQKLAQEIIIPKGTEVESDIDRVIFTEKTYELTIGIGDNDTATLYIGEGALKALSNPENKVSL